jgi:hypothetical protein
MGQQHNPEKPAKAKYDGDDHTNSAKESAKNVQKIGAKMYSSGFMRRTKGYF